MRTSIIFFASLLSMIAALWLRLAQGDPLREHVSRILGYENRAVVEHFLAAMGTPIFLALIVYIGCWLLDKFLEFLRLEFVRFRIKHRRKPVLPLDEVADPKRVFFAIMISSLGYCIASFVAEWMQADERVNCGSFGCFQYHQYAADFLGAVLATLGAYVIARRYQVGSLPTSSLRTFNHS